ncbi:hypothetical protein APHAL10511_001067 [Amanita phalloides]|nr:hypothetical protein APHAL10511_001067 [Amanita phalloides]
MNHYHPASHYPNYAELYDEDSNMYAHYASSDIQEFSDEPIENIFTSSPTCPGQEYQYIDAQVMPYDAYNDDMHVTFQDHSSYDSEVTLQSISSPQLGRGEQYHHSSVTIRPIENRRYEERDSYERRQYSSGPQRGTRLRPVSNLR